MYCDSPEDVEDLFQEMLLQLWRAYPRFEGKSAVSTWMYRVALNTAITRLRKNGSRLRPPQFLAALPELADEEPTPDREREQALYQAIGELNKFDKALVMLYLEDTPYADMADILDLTVSNVGVKLNRIKQKLRQRLNA